MICEKKSVTFSKTGALIEHFHTAEVFTYCGDQRRVLRQKFQEIYLYADKR